MRATIALTLEVLFLGLAFGLRSYVQWRRTGATGFVLPRRSAPLGERVGATLFVLAIVLMVAAPLAERSGFDRVSALDHAWVAALGVALGGAGIALCVVAQFAMGSSWRIGVDHTHQTDLVTAGVFRWIRNPIFSAMVVAVAALVLIVPNVIGIGALVALVVGLELQVRCVEEPYLRRSHGETYEQYTSTAGRFVPGLGLSRGRP